ncbi:AAA family ATPase [Actinopolymorpha pittospori]|uniref:ATPase n=1 Tax=Actinopolymorpha pittospori TaxID=648752 RepID=A0A927MSX8_9ACTN|nr:putative ATPase [Actinopolymorpha pittospori]
MDSAVVGRDAVLERAWRSLAGPGVVLIEGPAGIGKTAMWRGLVGRARAAGWRVLSCAPTEAEAALPFAALADLLRPLAEQMATLPRPQRVAAEVALLASDSEEPIDERALGAATRSLLDAAVSAVSAVSAGSAGSGTGETPVLVAVDDAPWLDRPSERALRFALRRVAPRLAVLVTCRSDSGPASVPPVPLGLDQEPTAGALTRIELDPLGVGATTSCAPGSARP